MLYERVREGVDHILGAIELKLGMQTLFGCKFLFLQSNHPSPAEGGYVLGVGGLWPHF